MYHTIASKMRGMWNTKSIENTSLHLVDSKYCSKKKWISSFLPLHFENHLCSPKTGNGEKKQLQSRWNEERGTLVQETMERQIKWDKRQFSSHKVQRNTFGRCFRNACCCPSIPAGYRNHTAHYLVVYIYTCNIGSTTHVQYIIPCPKSSQSEFIKKNASSWTKIKQTEKTGK